MVWKKRPSTPSTTASEFVRFGITSGSGRLASNPSSSCCSTLVTSSTTSYLRFRVKSMWSFLAVARMMIWTTRKKGLYDDANFSHRALVLYFRHQLRVKIRCDRKRLDHKTFDKRWVNAASKEVDNVGVILPSSSCLWRLRYGSFGIPSQVSRQKFPHPLEI